MAEGLKLEVGADIKAAEKALDTLVKDFGQAGEAAEEAGKKIQSGFSKPIPQQFSRSVVTATGALKQLPKSANAATGSLVDLGRIAQDAPFGLIGIANNITPAIEGLKRLSAASGGAGGALKALAASMLGTGGLIFVISLATAALSYFALSNRGAKKDVEETKATVDAAAERHKAFTQAIQAASAAVVAEAADLKDLRAILVSTTGSMDDLTDATIRQGVARFIFDSKNETIQKALAAQIERQIILLNRRNKAGLRGNTQLADDADLAQLEQQAAAYQKLRVSDVGLQKDIKRIKELNQVIFETGGSLADLNAISGGLTGFFGKFLDKDKKKAKEATDDIIAEAKRVAAFLEKETTFRVDYEFNPLDTEAEAKRKAQVFLDNVAAKRLTLRPILDIEINAPRSVTEFQQQLDVVQEGIKRGVIGKPIEIPAEINLTLDPRVGENAALVRKAREVYQRLLDSTGIEGLRVDLPEIDPQGLAGDNLKILSQGYKSLAKDIQFASFASDALANSMQSFFQAVIDGENPLKAFFQSVTQSLIQLISQLIAAQIRALIFKAIIGGATGGAGAGIAGAFQGIQFASGGLVTGPTLALIGEGMGTSRSNPEVVAPLDQLRAMIADMGGGDSGRGGVMTSRVRGRDILLVENRGRRSNRRLGATR